MKLCLKYLALGSALLLCLLSCHKDDPSDSSHSSSVSSYSEPPDDHLGDTNLTPLGAVNSLFSVSSSLHVMFSRGNLQYSPKSGTWRFALHQYDYAHTSDTSNAGGEYNLLYSGWIDLFGWGTSGYQGHDGSTEPFSTSYNYYTYGPPRTMSGQSLDGSSIHYDWAYHNAISNGGNQPETWRTLSINEWRHLLFFRPSADSLRAFATVAGVHGLLLLPDNWQHSPLLPVNFPSNNDYSASQWVNMQAAGAVFLPAAGLREELAILYTNSLGNYWSSTCDPDDYGNAQYIILSPNTLDTLSYYKSAGMSVRPVIRAY